ncbi:MAG: hypothetical protein ACI4VQ_02500 [Clostridia bacterium]
MKNILISVITVLLTILIIVAMIRGITIGKIEILSVVDIRTNSDELDKKIEDLNVLKNVTYKKKLSDLEASTKTLTTNKQKYLDLASVSTDEEIKQANQEQTYAMEFLWNKVGNYATKEGLTLKWVVTPTGTGNKTTLNFTLNGSYIGIINYISDIENDADLSFRIENFKLTTGSSENQLNATFTVSNIGIKQESTNSTVTSTKTNTTTGTSTNTTTEKNSITEVKDTDTSAEDRIDAAVNG